MNSNSGNSGQYNAEDIRRYVQGELSPAEMHRMEKAALDDPFLADAMEGYSEAIESSGLPSVDTGYNDLQKALEERVKQKDRQLAPVIRFKWWQAAAAAAVIISAGVLSYNSYKDGGPAATIVSANETLPAPEASPRRSGAQAMDSSMAFKTGDTAVRDNPAGMLSVPDKKEQPALSEAPAAMNKAEQARIKAVASAPVSTGDASLEDRRSTDATKAMERARRVTEAEKPSDAKPAPGLANVEKDMVANNDQAFADRDRSFTVKKKSSSDSAVPRQPDLNNVLQGRAAGVQINKSEAKNVKNDQASTNKTSDISRQLLYYQGQVLSANNKPLSNAILKLTNQKKAYSTDNNGNFTIPSVDSVIIFDVTLVGKDPKRFTLNSNNGFSQLILPDAEEELSEVVVMGYGTKKKEDVTSSGTVFKTPVFNAAPVSGWPGLQEYFEKNKNKALIHTPGAPTDVHFRVSKNGLLSGFRVTRSISPEHDKEAIRLLKDGPKWNLIKGRKADITVTIIF